MANDYNRDVLRFRVVTDKYSQGCNNLIKQKSKCATSAADLVYILNGIFKGTKPVQKQLFVTLDDDEQKYMITY
jgi:DNA processing protein